LWRLDVPLGNRSGKGHRAYLLDRFTGSVEFINPREIKLYNSKEATTDEPDAGYLFNRFNK